MSASLVADRAALVDALTTTLIIGTTEQDLDPTATVPAPIVAFDAWPVADGSSWTNSCAAESRWRVYVALPAGDPLSTAAAYDAAHDAIAPLLAKLGRVEDVTPAIWPVSSTEQIPVLQISVTL